MTILDIEEFKNNMIFVKTCNFYPEQYDVWKNGIKIGYVRLRGLFNVHPYINGEIDDENILFEELLEDDGYFANDNNRKKYLQIAETTLKEFWSKQ